MLKYSLKKVNSYPKSLRNYRSSPSFSPARFSEPVCARGQHQQDGAGEAVCLDPIVGLRHRGFPDHTNPEWFLPFHLSYYLPIYHLH